MKRPYLEGFSWDPEAEEYRRPLTRKEQMEGTRLGVDMRQWHEVVTGAPPPRGSIEIWKRRANEAQRKARKWRKQHALGEVEAESYRVEVARLRGLLHEAHETIDNEFGDCMGCSCQDCRC